MKPLVLAFALLVCAAPVAAIAQSHTEPPVPVRTVPPEFPYDLRRAGVSGVVMVNCRIDETGAVQDMKVTKSSNQAFEEPALDALKKWKFKPAKREGNPVSVRVTIPIRFALNDD